MQITIEMFSGRANPTWTVSGKQETELLQQITEAPGIVATRPAESVTGFRGLRLSLSSKEGSDQLANALGVTGKQKSKLKAGADPLSGGQPVWLANGLAEDGRLSQLVAAEIVRACWSDSNVVVRSLDGRGNFDYKFSQQVLKDVEARQERLKSLAGRLMLRRQRLAESEAPEGVALVGDGDCMELDYPENIIRTGGDFAFWNDPVRIEENNCYAYACNSATDTFPQPGRASGHEYQQLTCRAVSAAAVHDGLIALPGLPQEPVEVEDGYLVALVMAPGEDYHWYRLLADDSWGHKPGETEAVNTDDWGDVICNPEATVTGPDVFYTEFCGYFIVPPDVDIL